MKSRVYIFVTLALTLLVVPIGLLTRVFIERQEPESRVDFFEMSLEELMEVTIEGPGTLTEMSRTKAPSTVIMMRRQINYPPDKMESRLMPTLGVSGESNLTKS